MRVTQLHPVNDAEVGTAALRYQGHGVRAFLQEPLAEGELRHLMLLAGEAQRPGLLAVDLEANDVAGRRAGPAEALQGDFENRLLCGILIELAHGQRLVERRRRDDRAEPVFGLAVVERGKIEEAVAALDPRGEAEATRFLAFGERQ